MKYAKKMIMVSPGRKSMYSNKLGELDETMSTILRRSDIPDTEKVKMYNQVLSKYLAINQNKINVPERNKQESLKRKLSEYEVSEPKRRKHENYSDDEMLTAVDSQNETYDSDHWDDFETDIPIDKDQQDAINNAVLKRSLSDFMNKKNTSKQGSNRNSKFWSKLF